MSMKDHFIAASAVAVPPYRITQEEGEAFLRKHYTSRLSTRSLNIIHQLFSHPSICARHFAFADPAVLLDEDPDQRIARFNHWAVALSAEAAAKALARAGVARSDVSALVVNTCTGYLCPGISTYLIDELGLKKTTRVYDLVGGGCGGAIPNLEVCRGLLGMAPEAVVVSIAVEICSCAFQIKNDLSLLLSNAIFGDGAAAAVLSNCPPGLALVSSRSRYAPEYREDVRFIYKEGQLHNQLSPELPQLVAATAGQVVDELLTPHDLRVEDVRYWALHSGGENIINAVKEELQLTEEQVGGTRAVLARYGNMSSPTIWFVMEELQNRGLAPGNWLVMLAFGAGLSAHALLART